MVLKAWDLVTALTRRQLVTVLATVLFPAVPPLILFFLPDCVAEAWFIRVSYVAVYVVWLPSALLFVASMLKDDSMRAAQMVDRKIEDFSTAVKEWNQELEERLREADSDLMEQINQTDRVMREAFRQLDVDLPRREIPLGARTESGVPTGTAELPVSEPQGKWRRFCHRLRRFRGFLWRVIWGSRT